MNSSQQNELVATPGANSSVVTSREAVPEIVSIEGDHGRFVWEEFFHGRIANHHTRRAYLRAVHDFLEFCHQQAINLRDIMPSHVGKYVRTMAGSPASRKVKLTAMRHFFDVCVERHLLILNPASNVRGERYSVVEGKTPAISTEQARTLLNSIELRSPIGYRDRAIVATLAYSAARVGAVANLRLRDFYDSGSQYCLHFADKNGKSREIPVRHDLQRYLVEYIDQLDQSDSDRIPLFRTALDRSGRLSERGVTAKDIGRMIKRRIRNAGLPDRLSPHSLRVAVATDLLDQNIPLEDVQRLLGHSDARTTRLYDRRDRQVTRNIVERISI